MNTMPTSTIAFGLLVGGKFRSFHFRPGKAQRAARQSGGVIVPMIAVHRVRRLLVALDQAAGLGFIPGTELDELVSAHDELDRHLSPVPDSYWERMAAAHDAQATAHRLYLLACRTSQREDDATANAIVHNEHQVAYYERLAAEARAQAQMASTTCTEN